MSALDPLSVLGGDAYDGFFVRLSDKVLLDGNERVSECFDLFNAAHKEKALLLLEEVCKKLRAECVACQGSGRMESVCDERECEYCGRPRDSVRRLITEKAA